MSVAPVKRWAFGLLALLLVGAALTIGASRLLGRSGGRASVFLSVVAQWIAAYALWSFAGGLAVHYGALRAYEGGWFAAVALVGGYWHFRLRVRSRPDPARAVFVGSQLAWLAIVLVLNGLLGG